MTQPALPRLSDADLALAELTGGRRVWQMLALVALCLVLFLPGFFTLPPVDRDEARFSQASRQMAESGDFVDIRLGEDPRYKKPVGIYWLQTAAVKAVGIAQDRQIWVYRIPSLAGAVTSVLLTYLIALQLTGARQAFAAGALMAVCFVLAGEARIAKTDAVMLSTILAAQMVLARLWVRGTLPGGWPWLFWGAMGVSMLIKGPVGPMVVTLTIAALSGLRRSMRWLAPLRPGRGALLFLVIVLPWYVAITLRSGMEFWAESVGRDLLGKIGEGQESHGAPPGTYTLAVWLTFWPAAILLPFGLWIAWTDRAREEVRFLIAWILPTWIVFEIAATKLIHYVLPTYPALAILCAMGWFARTRDRPSAGYSLFLMLMLLLGPVLVTVPLWFAGTLGTGLTLVWCVGLALVCIGMWITWTRIRAGDRFAPLIGLAFLSVGVATALFGHLSRTPALWPSDRLAEIQAGQQMCEGAAHIATGYAEASLLLRTDPWPVFRGAEDTARLAEAAPCALVFVAEPQVAAFEAARTAQGWQTLGTVEGFNLGNAQDVRITAYRFN